MKKILPAAAACFLILCPSIRAGEPTDDQTRLVKLELELGLRKADGLGPKHPVIRRLEAGIRMIEKRVPEVRDEEYRKLLENNRTRLKDEQARLGDNGYGENHPELREILMQLKETDRRLAMLKR